MEASDKEVIAAGINALGGLYRDGLTRDCTHLIAPRPGSDKYSTALHFQKLTNVKIVLPHWFDDCFRLMMRLDETPYAWPEPPIAQDGGDSGDNEKRRKGTLTQEKKTMFKTVMLAGNSSSPAKGAGPAGPVTARADLWNGRRILLSPSLELEGGRRASLEVGIARAGGVIVQLEDDDDETDMVAEADILVTRYRAGPAYIKVLLFTWTSTHAR